MFDHAWRDPLQVPVLVVRERNKPRCVQFPVLLWQLVLLEPDGVDGVGVREVAPGAVLEDQTPVLEPLPHDLKCKRPSKFSILKKPN